MFCRFCGSTVPEDSTFCQLCGKALTPLPTSSNSGAAPALAPIPTPQARQAGTKYQSAFIAAAVVLLLVLGMILWAANKSDSSVTSTGFRQTRTQVPTPQLRRFTIGTGALTVNANAYSYYTLTVPPGAKNVTIQGRFAASGGSGNDIEVFLLNDTEYINWRNGHSTPTLYNSGKVTVADVNAILPNDVGTYYLIFNNRFSLLTPKAVEQNITLTYYQ